MTSHSAPNGQTIWVTSAAGPDVTAFDTRTHRVLFHIPVGAPPQHLVFAGGYAYLTCGYGSTIEKVNAATGQVITRTSSPYGSSNSTPATATSSVPRSWAAHSRSTPRT